MAATSTDEEDLKFESRNRVSCLACIKGSVVQLEGGAQHSRRRFLPGFICEWVRKTKQRISWLASFVEDCLVCEHFMIRNFLNSFENKCIALGLQPIVFVQP
jgi:hypothetical protein